MHSATITNSVSSGSTQLSGQRSVSGEGKIEIDVSVGAGSVGTLSTRTDANTGVITGPGGHPITTGLIVDVYWEGGYRRGMTVGTVSVNSIPIDGGSGDDLPIATTAITIARRTQVELAVIGDEVQALALHCASRAVFSLADGSSEHLGKLVENKIYAWDAEDGSANPIAGDTLTQVFLSHAATAAKDMKVLVIYTS